LHRSSNPDLRAPHRPGFSFLPPLPEVGWNFRSQAAPGLPNAPPLLCPFLKACPSKDLVSFRFPPSRPGMKVGPLIPSPVFGAEQGVLILRQPCGTNFHPPGGRTVTFTDLSDTVFRSKQRQFAPATLRRTELFPLGFLLPISLPDPCPVDKVC